MKSNNIFIRLSLSIFLGMSIFIALANAHGEHEKGPHGGVIRMPGAFHTELLKTSNSEIKIYLLDIEFKNPVTENSKVSVYWYRGTKSKLLKCNTEKDYFKCNLPIALKLKDKIEIRANRQGTEGDFAKYNYPF